MLNGDKYYWSHFYFFLSLQYENVVKDHKKNQKINKLDKY